MVNNMYYTIYADRLEQLEQAEQQAFIDHADLRALSIYDDIVKLKKKMITDYLIKLSSGTIAGIIGKSKYKDIDNAINKTVLYICEKAEPEELHDLRTDPEGIAELIRQCYKAKDRFDFVSIGG